jgi:hypothetical protein
MASIEVALTEEAAEWAQAYAAKRQISVSRLLRKLVRDARDYEKARQYCLSVKGHHFEWVDGRRPTREELYDRGKNRREET